MDDIRISITEHGTVIYESLWHNGSYVYHRDDGPAIVEPNGDKEWWVDGVIHREGAPAVEKANGDKLWYFQGERHRLDGPAVERSNGRMEWWLWGDPFTKEEFDEIISTVSTIHYGEDFSDDEEIVDWLKEGF